MRFTLGVAVGIVIGWAVASRLHQDEEHREARSMLQAMTRHPSAQRFGRRVADLAGERGTDAIRRARANIQRRLEANADDLSMN